MPWITTTNNAPAHYQVPVVSSASLSRFDIESAKKERAYYATEMQTFKQFQKEMSQSEDRDIDAARFFGNEFKECLKWEKASDFVVKWLEGNIEFCDWKTSKASEELAPYIDQMFNRISHKIDRKDGRVVDGAGFENQ